MNTARVVVDETSALAMASLIASGAERPKDLLEKNPGLLQPLLAILCGPSDRSEASKTRKIRLDAVIAIGNQGFSVNGALGTTTALHRACSTGSVDLVSALLTFGANPRARDEKGHTPLQILGAIMPERDELTRMLRAAELRMTAMQAIQSSEPAGDLAVCARDVLVARAYRGAAKKMGV